MISSLILRDFQKHRRLKIKLDPHVTTIVGPTDVGKSAILRALKWACLNTPRGDAFVRKGSPYARVVLRVDGAKIARERGKRGNVYVLGKRVFQAFGNNVPKNIAAHLNVSKLNIAGQMDAPFWFAEGAPEVSRQLNAIVDLGVIDTTLGNLSASLRKATAEVVFCTERLEAAREAKRQLKWAEHAHRDLEAVEGLAAEHSARALRGSRLQSLVFEAKEHLEARKVSLEALRALRGVVASGTAYKAARERSERLQALHKEVRGLHMLIAQPIPHLKDLDALGEQILSWRSSGYELETLVENGRKLQKEVRGLRVAMKEAKETLQTEMGTACVLCGQALQS